VVLITTMIEPLPADVWSCGSVRFPRTTDR
jgi:hypothetical protein